MKKSAHFVGVLGMLMSMSAFACAEQAKEHDGDKQKRTPPPEALAACNALKSGDICQFTGRRGDILKGTCFAPTERPLACRPANAPKDPKS